MKVVLINGSPRAAGCTYTALEQTAKALTAEGVSTEIVHIGTKPVRGCAACFGCRKNGNGRCVFDDDVVNSMIEKVHEADAVILGSPVYFAGMSGQMKSMLDRVFFAGGGALANKLGASVVSCRRGGASAAFDQMNHYFTIARMHVVSSQYWNQVHGMTPDDVNEDAEGLQTLRTMAVNMAWLLKCIKAGRESGVPMPVYEAPVQTNFISR